VLGALGVGAAYALSRVSAGWLWAGSVCLVVQWLGDANGVLAVLAPGPTLYLVANATLVLLGVGMVATLVARVAQNLSRLAREEPCVRTSRTSHVAATRRLDISASA